MVQGQHLRFFFHRLKNASFPELIYRIKEAFIISRCRAKFNKGTLKIKVPPVDHSAIRTLQLPDFDFLIDEHTFHSVHGGEIFTLNGNKVKIEQFEKECRGVFFADVPHAQTNLDIRMVWEPARLQHLSMLLIHLYIDKSQSLAEGIQDVTKTAILDWIEKNPFLSGPHYLSAMECGLRVPVFLYSLKILKNLNDSERNLIVATIYHHAWWIEKRLSLYSSLGNHTIAECIGLVFAGAIFRSTPQGREWLELSTMLLKKELSHQILDDGGPAEQSLSYLRFILDLYWLAIGFLEKNLLHDCQDFMAQLHLGENFLNAFHANLGFLPQIGDSDDGYAVAPEIFPKRIHAT